MRVLLTSIIAAGVLASCSDRGASVSGVPDSGPPRVVATDPPDGARGPFPRLFSFGDGEDAPHFVVRFSTPVRISSLEPGMIRVAGFPADVLVVPALPEEAGGEEQDLTETVGFHLLIPNLVFPQWYEVGRSYEVTIDTTLRSADGEPLAAAYRFSYLPEPSLRVMRLGPADEGGPAVHPVLLTVQFNGVMTADAGSHITLAPAIAGAWVNASAGEMPSRFVFDASGAVRSGTRYVIRVGSGVRDRNGYALVGDVASDFATAAFSVGEVRPAPGATGVPVATVIAVACGWPADLTSLEAGVTITPPVPGRWINESNPERFVLLPDDDLDEAAVYTVRINSSVRAIDGTPLPSPVEWQFTTAADGASLAAMGHHGR